VNRSERIVSRERRVFGKHRVIARLGRGGMGNVFLAANMGSAGVVKLVVVKELREELASVPEARSMFLDEARVATRLTHPNVVQAFEVVEEDDSLFLTTEFLDGQPLERLIRGDKRALFPVNLQLRVLADALGALDYAHELTDHDGAPLGLVHRDVGPHNIFVTYDGTAKLVDFGLGRAKGTKTVTESGALKGKVRFSSPEQAIGTDVDRRSDLFAAGGVLREILTGEPMWEGLSDAKILLELASGRVPEPRAARPDVPEALEAICRKALAPAREERYATAREFREAILGYLHTHGDPGETQVALGEAMARAFERERREIHAIIDAEIRSLREDPSASAGSRRLPLLAAPVPGATAQTGVARTRAAPPPPSGRRVVAIALVVCCLLAGAIYSLSPPPPRRPARRAPAAASDTPPESPRTVRLRLRARPSSASFRVDDASVLANPYEGDVPSDAVIHRITVTADGYEPRHLEATFDRDVALDVTLAPAEPGRAKGWPNDAK
jgi:serine/threonine protein kinase